MARRLKPQGKLGEWITSVLKHTNGNAFVFNLLPKELQKTGLLVSAKNRELIAKNGYKRVNGKPRQIWVFQNIEWIR